MDAERKHLDTALNNITHGLTVYDANGTVLTINKTYLKMFEILEDIVRPDLHFTDLT